MTLNIRTFDDDLIEVEVTGWEETTEQSEVIDPNQARLIAEKLNELADRQERKARA